MSSCSEYSNKVLPLRAVTFHLSTCFVTTVPKSSYMFFSSFHCYSSAESEDLAVHLYPGAVTIQGVLRRKTLLKEGKKPTVRSDLIF